MQVSSDNGLSTLGIEQKKVTKSNFALEILAQLPKDLQQAFNDASAGLDPELKKLRAISFSFNMQNPLFLQFADGNYPEKMPSDVRSALEMQNAEYSGIKTEKEQNAYKIKWMLEHIGFKDSSDPEAEGFYKEVYQNYTGVTYGQDNSRDAINEKDAALQQFKKDLSSKGASKFLHDFNQEKIDKLVEDFKDKLLKELKANPDADIDVEKLVSEYKKELLERLAELEKKGKKSPLNIEKMKFDMLSKVSIKLEDVLAEV